MIILQFILCIGSCFFLLGGYDLVGGSNSGWDMNLEKGKASQTLLPKFPRK